MTYMYGDMTKEANTVTITKSRYEELIEAEDWLGCLEAAGVDNWDGFDYALEIYKMDNNNDEED